MSENKTYNEGYNAGLKAVRDICTEIELRDRFAMAALTGLLAGDKDFQTKDGNGVCGSRSDFCKLAFYFADAMLKERTREFESNFEPIISDPTIMDIP